MIASRGMGAISPSKMPGPKRKARRDDTDFTQYAEGGNVKVIKTDADRKARNEEFKKLIIGDDLASARRKGQTYNEMFAEQREEGRKKGFLSEEAYKAGKAYELYTPKEVREAYEADPKYFEKRAKEGTEKGMKKGGEVWDTPNPAKKTKHLTPAKKSAAKAAAKAAGRVYPNLIDNMRMAKK